MSELTKPAVQRLEAWMKEITDLICYQPEVPTAHKSALIDAFVAFQNEITDDREALLDALRLVVGALDSISESVRDVPGWEYGHAQHEGHKAIAKATGNEAA